MLLGIRNPAATEPYSLASVEAWQGKSNAIAQTYVRSTWTADYVVSLMAAIWQNGSVPAVSYDLQVTNMAVNAGEIDPSIDALAAAMKQWLAGPDGTYGSGDDRRAYFRPAWEANGNWYRWSPCYYAGGTGTPDDYRAMWRRLHGRFASAGIDRDHLAWVFSVNYGDKVAACSAEVLYPGDAYVDWTGIDAYTSSSFQSPFEVLDPMTRRLRSLAPSKPVSVNEWGSDTLTNIGKSSWIDGYWSATRALDIRMSLVFNIDKERDWAVFGGSGGDELFAFGGVTRSAWSSYRKGVADERVAGADRSNPRLLTSGRFLGVSG